MISHGEEASGRLNAFQRVLYQWSLLHPYNATHTYKIAGPARPEDLGEAIGQTYRHNGLGKAEISPDGLSYRHDVGQPPDVPLLPGGDQPESVLAEYTTRELNRPFDRPVCQPFRFAMIDAGPAAHYVTTTYDHWAADSVSARLVLRHVLGRYCGLSIPENDQPLELYPGTYRQAFGRQLRGVRLAMAAARALRRWRKNRTAWQVAYSSSAQMAVGYQLHMLAPGGVEQLRHFARSLGATVHDVVLAALARTMGEFLPRRSSRGKSREMSLGTTVDTRPMAGGDLSRTVGVFLAYYLVRRGHDRSASLAETTRQVAEMTRPIKQRQRYLDSVVNMKAINAIWPYLPEAWKPQFSRRVLPMTAAVTNVVLRERWLDENRGRILGYSRGSPTGPNVALALAPTTFGDAMTIGISYRATGFSQEKIDGVAEMLLDQLEHPTRGSQAVAGGRRRWPGRDAKVAA